MVSSQFWQGANIQYKVGAFILWALSCTATVGLVAQLAPRMPLVVAVGIGIAVQVLFTLLEHPLLSGNINIISIVFLVADIASNIGGSFFLFVNLGNTATWRAIAATFDLTGPISEPTVFAISFLVGLILALSPEIIWKWQ